MTIATQLFKSPIGREFLTNRQQLEDFMKVILKSLCVLTAILSALACSSSQPTASNPANLALQLEFVKGVLHRSEAGNYLRKSVNIQQVNRIEIYVFFDQDTLAHTTIRIPPGDSTFSASLDVTPGEDRRIVVEAWSDDLEVGSLLEYRGVTSGVQIESGVEQHVTVTLFPLAIPGRRVVMIAGSGAGAAGANRNLVPFSVISADDLRAVQLDVHANVNNNAEGFGLSPRDATRDVGLPLQNLDSNIIATTGPPTLRVVLFDDAGRTLPPQEKPSRLFEVNFQVNSQVAPGTIYRIWISNVAVRAAGNNQLEVLSLDGQFEVR